MSFLCEQFQEVWKVHYGLSNPMTPNFKYDFEQSWIRFHTLPYSKRYAENDAEKEIILKRQKAVFFDVINSSAPYLVCYANFESWLVDYEDEEEVLDYDAEDEAFLEELNSRKDSAIERLHSILNFSSCFTFEDDDRLFQLQVSEAVGDFPGLDEILNDVAEDDLDFVFFLDVSTGYIFAPYDGGIDVICHSELHLHRLKKKYASFLPKYGSF